MRNCLSTIIFCIIYTFLAPLKGQTCTTFCLDHGDRPVFGRNLDWYVGDGLVIINKRGVKKTANADPLEGTTF